MFVEQKKFNRHPWISLLCRENRYSRGTSGDKKWIYWTRNWEFYRFPVGGVCYLLSMVDKCYRQQVQGGNETVRPAIPRDYKLKVVLEEHAKKK